MYKLKTTVNFPDINIGGTTDHSKLSNLDYDNSGHTGFASKQDLEIKVDKVDGKQLSTEDYTTEEKNKLNSLENYDDTQIKENINEIESKIPAQASNTNQLADKEFVNSSISTNTATFRGTYNTLEELQQQQADINDYGFVISTDSSGNTLYNRYKYTGEEWVFEYSLNNSSFTANQWASINSGITSEKVSKIGENETNISNLETNKVDKITGKGLSENDYTNGEKEKLASLENYTLPIASADTLGGIKIGENLNIDENGVVSASGGGEKIYYYEYYNSYGFSDKSEASLAMFNEIREKLENGEHPMIIVHKHGFSETKYWGSDIRALCTPILYPTWNSEYMIIKSAPIYSTQQGGVDKYYNIQLTCERDSSTGLIKSINETYQNNTRYLVESYQMGSNERASSKNLVLTTTNTDSYTPTSDYNPSTKLYTDKTHYENMAGYDASKTQVLKNVNGTLTWVSE